MLIKKKKQHKGSQLNSNGFYFPLIPVNVHFLEGNCFISNLLKKKNTECF